MLSTRQRHLVALGLARSLLAGSQQRHSLHARAAHALGHGPQWLPGLLEQVFPVPEASWARFTVDELALRIEQAPAFGDAFRSADPPQINPAKAGRLQALWARIDWQAA